VVAEGVEQLALPGAGGGSRRLTRRTISRAVTCWALGREVNEVNTGTSATAASETDPPAWASKTALGYLIAVYASGSMLAMASVICGLVRAVIENLAPAARAAPTTSCW